MAWMAALREDEPLMVAEQDDPGQARGGRVWMATPPQHVPPLSLGQIMVGLVSR